MNLPKDFAPGFHPEMTPREEAIVRDCAHTAWIALGGQSHKVSENTEIYRAQDHALATASKAILARYGLEEK